MTSRMNQLGGTFTGICADWSDVDFNDLKNPEVIFIIHLLADMSTIRIINIHEVTSTKWILPDKASYQIIYIYSV